MTINFKESFIISQNQNINLYKKYINPGLSKAFTIFGYNSLDIKKAKNSFIYLNNGSKILDLTSSLGVNNLGHNNSEINAAERYYNSKYQIDCQKFGVNKLQSVLANNLQKLLNNNLTLSFFATSGAEANEAGMKLCMAYNSGKKDKFVTFSNSYHGKTLGSLSLTNVNDFQDNFFLGIDKKNILNLEFNNISLLEKTVLKFKNRINAIIIEPIQGQTMEVVNYTFMKKIEYLCKKYNIILFIDEIKCGLSRAKGIFYYKKFNIKADILTISKSLGGGKNPISAMICDKKIFLKSYGSINRSNIHTTTFFGLGKSCSTAIKTLEIISHNKFQNNLNRKIEFVKNKIYQLKINNPNMIKDIKGDGLFIGIQINLEKFVPFINKKILKKNTINAVIMASIVRFLLDKYKILTHFEKTSPDVLRFMPSLTITHKEINYFFNSLDLLLSEDKNKTLINFVLKNIKSIKELL